MSDPLSIRSAAADAAGAVALHAGDEPYTFGDLAQQVESRLAALADVVAECRVYPLIGSNTLDTVVTLLALLEARVPVLLLHPKLTEAERAVEIAATVRAAHALPADAAVIMYTSGTTGRSRGAVLTRSALLASAQASAANLGWQPDDCWLLAMPLARVGGLSILTRCLAARRAVALAPGFDVERLPGWIDAARATLVSLVPTMASLLFAQHPQWRAPPFLRAILIGGAAAAPRLLADASRREVPIVITYGCTETCSQIVATPYGRRFDAASCGAGRPLPGAEVRVVDGRIEARGPMLMAGYLGEPPLDSEAWFDTGDLGAFDAAGCLHVHARRIELIVSGGNNVYPAEVERVLDSCPGIAAAAVFGVPDDTWGEIVAALLVADGAPPSDAELSAFLEERLARFKRPRCIAFTAELPHSGAGKLDRGALAAYVVQLRPLGSTARD